MGDVTFEAGERSGKLEALVELRARITRVVVFQKREYGMGDRLMMLAKGVPMSRPQLTGLIVALKEIDKLIIEYGFGEQDEVESTNTT